MTAPLTPVKTAPEGTQASAATFLQGASTFHTKLKTETGSQMVVTTNGFRHEVQVKSKTIRKSISIHPGGNTHFTVQSQKQF